MKSNFYTLTIFLLLFMGQVQAHSKGHGGMSAADAVELAHRSAQKLAFKDLGLAIGNLDSSWKNVGKKRFVIKQDKGHSYVISATHPDSKETLFFQISKSGQLQHVSRQPIE